MELGTLPESYLEPDRATAQKMLSRWISSCASERFCEPSKPSPPPIPRSETQARWRRQNPICRKPPNGSSWCPTRRPGNSKAAWRCWDWPTCWRRWLHRLDETAMEAVGTAVADEMDPVGRTKDSPLRPAYTSKSQVVAVNARTIPVTIGRAHSEWVDVTPSPAPDHTIRHSVGWDS
jgi:hypothetical protein